MKKVRYFPAFLAQARIITVSQAGSMTGILPYLIIQKISLMKIQFFMLRMKMTKKVVWLKAALYTKMTVMQDRQLLSVRIMR